MKVLLTVLFLYSFGFLQAQKVRLIKATSQKIIAGSGVKRAPSDTTVIDYGPDGTQYVFAIKTVSCTACTISIDTVWIWQASYYCETPRKNIVVEKYYVFFYESEIKKSTKSRKYKGVALISYRVNGKRGYYVVQSLKELPDGLPE